MINAFNIPWVELILVLLSAGLFGGLTAWLTEHDSPLQTPVSTADPYTRSAPLRTYLAGGLVASFAVPLFLRLTDSDLVDHALSETNGKPSDIIVLAGFCLVAAFSSKAFIQSLSYRLLMMARQAKDEAAEAKKQSKINEVKIERVEDAVDNDPGPESEVVDEVSMLRSAPDLSMLTDIERVLIVALENSRYSRRSIGAMAREIGLAKTRARKVAEGLVKQGLLKKAISVKTGNTLYSLA